MSENKKDPKDTPQIQTVADMMRVLQEEAVLIKNGTMDLSTARILSKFRGLQIQAAQLLIQHQRINRPRSGATRNANTTYDLSTGREVPVISAGEAEAAPAAPRVVPHPGVPEVETG